MKFLKTATERAKAKGGVKGLIHHEVGGFEDSRDQVEIHASELTKDSEYCPRQVRLMELMDKKHRDRWINMPLRITFDEGKDKQYRLNNDYLKKYMVGFWVDPYAFDEDEETPSQVWNAGAPDDFHRYVEPFFIDPISEAQGSIDGLVKLPEQEKLRVIEVKIMATSMFRDLRAPLGEHKLRTQFYLTLIARSDHPYKAEIDWQKASILYWLRGYGFKDDDGEISPFKEFIVKRDDDAVEYLFDKAKALTLSRGGGPLPDKICIHQMCPRAGKCPVSKECFSNAPT